MFGTAIGTTTQHSTAVIAELFPYPPVDQSAQANGFVALWLALILTLPFVSLIAMVRHGARRWQRGLGMLGLLVSGTNSLSLLPSGVMGDFRGGIADALGYVVVWIMLIGISLYRLPPKNPLARSSTKSAPRNETTEAHASVITK
jgi:hypothetical protein